MDKKLKEETEKKDQKNIYKTTVKEMESKQNLKDFMDNIPQYIDMCILIAKGEKLYYEELKKQGFTEEQSLKIVIEHGTYPGRTDRQIADNK